MASAYATLEKKIADVPKDITEEYVTDICHYIDYVIYCFRNEKKESDSMDRRSLSNRLTESERKEAIEQAFGMWENHDSSLTVDKMVRQMRKGDRHSILKKHPFVKKDIFKETQF